MKKFILIIPIVFLFSSLRAEFGCLVNGYPDLLVKQTKPPGGAFSNEDAIFPAPGCRWVLVSFTQGCVGHGTGGIKGEYQLECPLDDYVIGLIIFTTIAGVCYLQRKY